MSFGLEEEMIYARLNPDRACRHRCRVCDFCQCTGVGPAANAPTYRHSRFRKRRHPSQEAAVLDLTSSGRLVSFRELGRENIARRQLQFAAQSCARCIPDPGRNLRLAVHQDMKIGRIECE